MHKSGKEPVFKIWQVQGGKFFAAFKTVFVNAAFVIAEKRTGHTVHDHKTATAFFKVFLIKIFPWLAKLSRKIIRLLIRNKHHQAFATVTAGGATDPGSDGFIELKHKLVYLLPVPFFHKYFKPVVLSCMCRRKGRNAFQVGFNMCGRGLDGANLSFTPFRELYIQVFDGFIHILRPFVEK